MQIKTILNRVQKFKSFVYGAVRWVEGASVPTFEVELEPRSNSRPDVLWLWAAKARLRQASRAALRVIPMWATSCSLFMRLAGSSVQTAVSR